MDTREIRFRRLRMRSWRRGTKEMDLILGPYSDGPLRHLDDGALDDYEALLLENDQDLYLWVSGARTAPAEHAAILQHIRAHHAIG